MRSTITLFEEEPNYGLRDTRVHAQLAMAAIGQNLLKAANKITLTPQTQAIA